MSGVSVNLKNLIYPDEGYGPMKVAMFWTRGASNVEEYSDWLRAVMENKCNIIDIIQCESAAYVYYQERVEK